MGSSRSLALLALTGTWLDSLLMVSHAAVFEGLLDSLLSSVFRTVLSLHSSTRSSPSPSPGELALSGLYVKIIVGF